MQAVAQEIGVRNPEWVVSPEQEQPGVEALVRFTLYHDKERIPNFIARAQALQGTEYEESLNLSGAFSALERMGIQTGLPSTAIPAIERMFPHEPPTAYSIPPADITKCWRRLQVLDKDTVAINYSLEDWWNSAGDPDQAALMRLLHIWKTGSVDTQLRMFVHHLNAGISAEEQLESLTGSQDVTREMLDEEAIAQVNDRLDLKQYASTNFNSLWMIHGFAGNKYWADPILREYIKSSAQKNLPNIAYAMGGMGAHHTLAPAKLRAILGLPHDKFTYKMTGDQFDLAELSTGIPMAAALGWSMGARTVQEKLTNAVVREETIKGAPLHAEEPFHSQKDPFAVLITPSYAHATPLTGAVPENASLKEKAIGYGKDALVLGTHMLGDSHEAHIPLVERTIHTVTGKLMGDKSRFSDHVSDVHSSNLRTNNAILPQRKTIRADRGTSISRAQLWENRKGRSVVVLGSEDGITPESYQQRAIAEEMSRLVANGINAAPPVAWVLKGGQHDLPYTAADKLLFLADAGRNFNHRELRQLDNVAPLISSIFDCTISEGSYNEIKQMVTDLNSFVEKTLSYHDPKGRTVPLINVEQYNILLNTTIEDLQNHEVRTEVASRYLNLVRTYRSHFTALQNFLQQQEDLREKYVGQ